MGLFSKATVQTSLYAPSPPQGADQDDLFSPTGRPRLDLFGVRKSLAEHYLSGRGIEFGALHAGMELPWTLQVRYADMMSAEDLKKAFPELEDFRAPDIVTDLESMRGIESASEDFIIANHVMEHVEDPFRALKSMARVLRPNGVAFLALPDKRYTFDRDRTITPLEHLIRDHEEGPDWSLKGHYEEWVDLVDKLEGGAAATKKAQMLAERANIHFHCWDYPAMMEMFAYVARRPDIDLEVELSVQNTMEVVWVLRKPAKADVAG